MSEFIPLSVPAIKGNAWKYVKDCLDTEWVSSAGSYVKKFEEEICKFTGAKYSIACVNGTSALHIALILVGVKKGEEVIVPTVTFIAPINTVRYMDANPLFMDCDEYYNLDVEKTLNFILKETSFKNGNTYNNKTGARIAAIIPVHVFGNAVNLNELVEICLERNIKIIEDATESLGTRYNEGKYSSRHTGLIGDVGCLSFNGNKIITSGGGGMILTSRSEYAERGRYLTTQAKDDELRYIHQDIGYNYRLSNMQAALGVAQLEMLTEYLTVKKENYFTYRNHIKNIKGLALGAIPPYADNNCWMYALKVNEKVYSKTRDEVIQLLFANKIQSRPLWYLNHLQKPYETCQSYMIEKAGEMHRETLNLPCSTNLTKKQILKIIELLKNV